MDAWKKRFAESISNTAPQQPEEQTTLDFITKPTTITIKSPVQQKINSFLKGKEDILPENLNLDQEYE